MGHCFSQLYSSYNRREKIIILLVVIRTLVYQQPASTVVPKPWGNV